MRFQIKQSQRTFLLIIFFLVTGSNYGHNWKTRHYTILDGLPNPYVKDLIQDKQGTLWFATIHDISSYDGLTWKNHSPLPKAITPIYSKLGVDKKNRIWAASLLLRGRLTILCYDGTRWFRVADHKTTIQGETDISAFKLLEHPGRHHMAIVICTRSSGVYLREKNKWSHITTKEGLLSNTVNGAAILDGALYFATAKGLSVRKSDGSIDNWLNQSLKLPSTDLKAICLENYDKYASAPLKNPRLWLYGSGWLGYFDKLNHGVVCFNTGVTLDDETYRIQLMPDYRGGLYFGNVFELHYFNYTTRVSEHLTIDNGLVGAGTHGLLIDFEKNVWIASARGITKLANRHFENYQAVHGLLEDEVTSVLEYKPGKFVLGHNKGVTFWDGKHFSKLPFSRKKQGLSFIPCRILDMKCDSLGNIWAAAGLAGLVKIDKQRNFTWYGKNEGLLKQIVCLYIDEQNNIFSGSDSGVYVKPVHENVFKRVTLPGVPYVYIKKIYGNGKHMTYLGSNSNGIYVYNEAKEHWENYYFHDVPEGNQIFTIKKTAKGELLIGTRAGLYSLEKGMLKWFEKTGFEKKGFKLEEPVFFITEDSKRRLWFGTNNGVVRWDGKKMTRYSVNEGLVGTETNRATGIIDSAERLWIGTNTGVSIYNEQFDNYDLLIPQPKLRLLHLETGNKKRLPLDRPTRLSSKTQNLLFHFRGISFIDEKGIRFKYKLEGYDKEWSDESYPYKQAVRYTQLPPGSYRFHLKVRNSPGVWSEPVVSSKLTIAEPFYKQWWFRLLVFLALIFVLHSIFRFITAKRNAILLEKQVEIRTAELRASEQKYRSLFEDSRDMVFISKDNKLVDVNPAGVELLGYDSKEEMVNCPVFDFYYEAADRDTFVNAIKEKGYVKDYELVVKTKDGGKLSALVTASAVPGKDGPPSIRGIMRDITEKKRLQLQLAQAQKMEAIGTLAGGIAHDFNNLLSILFGYIELSQDEVEAGSTMWGNLEQMRIAAGRARELVKQILTFSRQSTQAQEPLNVCTVLKESLKLLRSSLPSTLEIRWDIAVDSGIVRANPTQIQQVIMNLCTNAAFAMRDKGGILTVDLHEIHLDEPAAAKYEGISQGPYLRLSIGDTGDGIKPEIIKRIFDPFFTTKKVGEGTGMGLAVAHGIIKSHSGAVSVYSEPGKGSVFQVLLPLIEASHERQVREAAAIPKGSGQHILFVDDENSIVEMLGIMLKTLGYKVTVKSSSLDALDTFRQAPDSFHLVITDLTMPGMTGIQLAQQLRNLRPDIPIILCTGFSESITAHQIEELGVSDFLMKPVSKADLARAIRKALT
ncbi:MAG: response regulator [bacterium]|nr:response regulator [bacterium]